LSSEVPRFARNDAACIGFLAALGMTRHALGWCCGASAPQARLRLLKKAKACVIPRHVVPRKLAHDAYALATARATLFPHHFIGRHWATTLGRPYASLGDHAVSPLRFIGPPRCVAPTLHWATTRGHPYASLGDHAGSPLRFIGRPRGVTLTLHWATTLGRPYAYPRTHVPCGHDISCPCIDAPVIFATGDYLCTIHVQFSLRGLPDS
jgi:hypothetical protein